MKLKEKIEEIFYFLTILTMLFGGVGWLMNIDNKATAANDDLKEMKSQVVESQKAFEEIRIRLTHIEDALSK